MLRTRVRHRCEACGATSPRWLGRCPECGEWGAMVEETPPASDPAGVVRPESVPVPLVEVDESSAAHRATGLPEVDRVLGGGLVPGSVTLLGGEPGIGKSTLLLQVIGALAAGGARCLLVSAEESPHQVRLRAGRLGPLDARVLILGETSLPDVCFHAEAIRPDVLAVDSIQTVHDPATSGGPGSVAQVRDGAQRLVRLAKEHGIAVALVGHVTKEGALAGPRVLEHVVDTVLSFEGDRHHGLRALRALKHRFGSTDEVGLFEMTDAGLRAVPDASAFLLADRRAGQCGSVVAPILDGGRPLLVEVQALVAGGDLPVPRRSVQSLDSSRVAMVLAVLQERLGLPIARRDVYASVVGGVRVAEPGVDLAVALAVCSATADVAFATDTVALGEVGLGGEIRSVAHAARRLAEAGRMGFTRAVVPESTPEVPGLELVRVADLHRARDAIVARAVVRAIR